ncbi:MAG: AAA family ATPase [Saprospiraceae bacterium]|nr:AAA family ATPase [Candidatus Vicinibacter proximus]MBL7824375.1 AAA family ATPase [Saprospiraceae bacterium]MCC6843638.1 AAA family ATPase [Saprospiraceae bacterium]HRG31642.1 DEAD/DEAH box helicase [Saprospiraceae bacterium]
MLESKEVYQLHAEQHYALDRIQKLEGVVFLTGKAGTGKSTLLNLIKRTFRINMIVLAPTGVASVLVGGQTIHSFFKFPPGWISQKDYKPLSKSMAEKIDLIVIDEISMVRADILDHMDQLLKLSKKKDKPFGGIPMLWVGDLYQLPPVVSSPEEKAYFEHHYTSPYFFSANVMKELDSFELIELEQVFRQNELHFIRLLNRIRLNECDEEDLDEINQRAQADPTEDGLPAITLTSTNVQANQINLKELNKLDTSPKTYSAIMEGSINPSQFPAEQHLILKVGAQIMTLRNDPAKNFINGSIGILEELMPQSIRVKFPSQESSVEIPMATWEIVRYIYEDQTIKVNPVGSFTQLPVKLAWAVTIHKSQGKTFDKAIIDLGRGAFENGQTYVALSRCRTLDGVYLTQKLQWKDVRTDERVADFIRQWR